VSDNGTRPAAIVRRVASEFSELVGREPESVISLDRTDDGWRVGLEVLELHRVPDTADLLAEYEVEVDERGGLVSYRRTRRYARGKGTERT
jgi:hypothetical protein